MYKCLNNSYLMIVSGDAVRDKHTMPMPRHILCPCPQSPERQPAASRRDAGDGETGTGEFPMAFASSLCWRLRPEKISQTGVT